MIAGQGAELVIGPPLIMVCGVTEPEPVRLKLKIQIWRPVRFGVSRPYST